MSSYTVWRCDRCSKETRDVAQTTRMELPVPSGHVSRTDAYKKEFVDVCKECHLEFNRWWLRQVSGG